MTGVIRKFSLGMLILGLSASASAYAQEGGVQVGQLTCDVEAGSGFIFGSSKNLSCEFEPANSNQPVEPYSGRIDKYGIDIGSTKQGVIYWAVVAAEADKYEPGALRGKYTGASASAALSIGVGANVLIGGSSQSFSLQPVSLSASEGYNLALGVGQLTLR